MPGDARNSRRVDVPKDHIPPDEQRRDKMSYFDTDDPDTKGEARSGPTRLLVEDPLAVYFKVNEPDRLVTVRAVWRWRTTP